MRSSPSTKASVIRAVPIGASVTVKRKVDEDWYEVGYRTDEGFMMSKYLVEKVEDGETLTELKNKLKEALLLLDKLEAQK